MLEFSDGETVYIICNTGGEIHALEGLCPHLAGPLAHGALQGSNVVCPWHAWEFDCRTGECDLDPRIELKRFPVIVNGADILADLPENA